MVRIWVMFRVGVGARILNFIILRNVIVASVKFCNIPVAILFNLHYCLYILLSD